MPRTPVLQVVKLSNNRSRMLPVSHRGGGEGGDLGEGGDGDGGAGNEGNWLEETPPLGDKRDSGNREEGKEMERGEDRPAQVEANNHCMRLVDCTPSDESCVDDMSPVVTFIRGNLCC